MKRFLCLLLFALAAAAQADDPVLNLSAQQRYPWNRLVDVSFTLADGAWRYDVSLAATNAVTGKALAVNTVYQRGGAAGGALRFPPGETHLVWDAGTDVPGVVVESVALSVSATPVERPADSPLYIVVDLSGGASAASYPVATLDAEPAGGFNTTEYKTTKLVLRRIDPGTFTMGSPAGEVGRWDNYETQHSVTLTQAFYIGLFELTQKQWSLVMGSNPASYEGDARPVECVSYNDIRGSSAGGEWPASDAVDASSFLGKFRTRAPGYTWDLPTEAQWEYACRAGTESALNSGKDLSDPYEDANMAEVGRYDYNTGDGMGGYSEHTTVGFYLPNAWGIYDMHGNVWEWSRDRGSDSLGSEPATDPKGPASGSSREMRGGSWNNAAKACRSACRSSDTNLSNRRSDLGFRISMVLSE